MYVIQRNILSYSFLFHSFHTHVVCHELIHQSPHMSDHLQPIIPVTPDQDSHLIIYIYLILLHSFMNLPLFLCPQQSSILLFHLHEKLLHWEFTLDLLCSRQVLLVGPSYRGHCLPFDSSNREVPFRYCAAAHIYHLHSPSVNIKFFCLHTYFFLLRTFVV